MAAPGKRDDSADDNGRVLFHGGGGARGGHCCAQESGRRRRAHRTRAAARIPCLGATAFGAGTADCRRSRRFQAYRRRRPQAQILIPFSGGAGAGRSMCRTRECVQGGKQSGHCTGAATIRRRPRRGGSRHCRHLGRGMIMTLGKEPIRVLVIDDEPFVLKLLTRQLENLGCGEVTAFERTQDAVSCLSSASNTADLVFCDLQMPEMDGVQFVRELVRLSYAGSLVLVSGENERILHTAERLATAHKLRVLSALHK